MYKDTVMICLDVHSDTLILEIHNNTVIIWLGTTKWRLKTGKVPLRTVAYQGGVWGFQPPLPPEIPKTHQNRARLNPILKTVKIVEFRTAKPKIFGKNAVKF